MQKRIGPYTAWGSAGAWWIVLRGLSVFLCQEGDGWQAVYKGVIVGRGHSAQVAASLAATAMTEGWPVRLVG